MVNTTTDTQDANAGNGLCADAGGNCSLRAAITEANALAGADIITLPAGIYTTTLSGSSENVNASGDFDLTSEITINGAGSGSTIVEAATTAGVAVERVFHLRAAFPMTLNDMTIRHGRYATAAGTFGAGVRVDTAAVIATFNRVVIANNESGTSGGGLSISGAVNSITTLNNCRIENNSAGGTAAGSSTGAGIQLNVVTATLNITDSTISGNTASNTSTTVAAVAGGVSSVGTLNITNSVISNNTVTSSGFNTFSGGVHVTGGTTTILGSTISNNASTVTAGAGSGFAGGIYNQQATVNVTNSIVSGNSASSFHGGIRTLASTSTVASTTITNSTISNNTAVGEGGGVINFAGATFAATTTITGSTISGNGASAPTSLGGGLENFNVSTGPAVINVSNSTISGNTAASGAGTYNAGNAAASINLDFATIAGNTATTEGGGIFQAAAGGVTNLRNSIVADNAAPIGPDLSGAVTSQNYNHIEDVTGGTFTTFGDDVTGTDPVLGTLANNGGTTNTHLPAAGSPVMNSIPNGTNDCGVGVTTSQNGLVRPQQSSCEKGSVEVFGVSSYTIGGMVSNLFGTGLVLRNNGGDDLAIGSNGSFTFATPIASGSPYSVTVFTDPSGPSQTCSVSNGSGTVGTANVTSVAVSCTPDAFADLGITKTNGVSSSIPGGSTTYTIVASNAGPSSTTATVTDTFPAALNCTWSCVGAGGGSCTASDSGDINDTVNLPSGASTTYTASCAIAASATGTLVNTATIAASGGVADPTSSNNSATDTDTLVASADLAITKTDGATSAVPGDWVTYTITASNAGPSNVDGATVTDTFPPSETCTWTCVGADGGSCTASGSGDISQWVTLPSGGSTTYTAACSISASATGSLVNTATVAAPSGVADPSPDNNSATDTDTLVPMADLSISKTDGVTSATPGGSVTYTITAENYGPSDVSGAIVTDVFPATETCTWTCVGTGGGICVGSGSGDISQSVDLPSEGSTTFTAVCSIAASATGSLVNTATVAAPAGVTDPSPINDSATDTDNLVISADVAVAISDDRDIVQIGDSLDYLIEVTNPIGPSSAIATVSDILPAELTAGSWICSASGGASCGSPGGSGNTLFDTATLPVGGKTSYLYSTTLQGSDPNGMVVNTATASLTNGTDPNPANNQSTDTNSVVIFRDGFDPASDSVTYVVGDGSNHVTVQVQVDAGLLGGLGIVPTEIAGGKSGPVDNGGGKIESGRTLFVLQLARFGNDYNLRVLTWDSLGQAERSSWQSLVVGDRLLDIAWQAASAQANDGFLSVQGMDASFLIGGRSEQHPLTQLVVRVEQNTPWLVLVTP